ncbi:hypothetical protein Ciccas_010956 [Cichlidogyrus casuarinus]|uniref:Uncharacterized protein n=1 Tax=Cichlidogyrus casuarinus TaxID=1844966 RepID=A0ABD2PUN7_9PLAT
MGAIRVYEDYEDEENNYDPAPVELFKKTKIGKRSVKEDGFYNPRVLKEEFVEATSGGISPKMLVQCQKLDSDSCTCQRLFCFMETDCHSNATSVDSTILAKDESIMNLSKNETLAWLTRCRQTELAGQQLCECKRSLTFLNDIEKMETFMNKTVTEARDQEETIFGPMLI